MRPDFHQILTEAPRHKHPPTPRTRDPEATKEPMRAGYREKFEFGDRLGPLRRMLRAQVGRPWDDVYREICAWAKGTTLAGHHILEHVRAEVTHDLVRFGRRALFVDDDGILRAHAERRRVEHQADPCVLREGGVRWLATAHGWYRPRVDVPLRWDRGWYLLRIDGTKQAWPGKIVWRPEAKRGVWSFAGRAADVTEGHEALPGPFVQRRA